MRIACLQSNDMIVMTSAAGRGACVGCVAGVRLILMACVACWGSLAWAASPPHSVERRSHEVQQRDAGRLWAHPGTSLEWWYLTGPLWQGSDCDAKTGWSNRQDALPLFGAQVTFFYQGSGEQQGLVFHGAVSDVPPKTHDYGAMFEAWSAGAKNGLVGWVRSEGPGQGPNVGMGTHQIVALTSSGQGSKTNTSKDETLDPSLWLVTWMTPKFDVRLMASAPMSRLWKHGNNGWVKKLGDVGNTYVSLPFIAARGQVVNRVTGQTQEVCGSLWFDHEVDVQQVADVSWQWFALRFPDGRAYMIYRVFGKKSPSSQESVEKPAGLGSSKQGNSRDSNLGVNTVFGEAVSVKGDAPVFLRNIQILEKGPAVCLKSGRCYPQDFTLSFDEGHQSRHLEVSSLFAEQEVATGIGKTYWEGLVQVVDRQGGGRGIGYVELTE